MKGWKTWLAALGMFATGVGLAVSAILSDPIDGQKLTEGITLMAGALGLVGIGHKIEKHRL